MGFINLPATLQNLFASLETRILKLETATRFTAPNVTTDPSLPRKGDIVLNTTSNSLKYVDNTGAFIPLGASTAVSSVTATAPITSSGGLTPNIALTNVGTAGTYTKVTTDASGRVSSGTTLAAGDIPTGLNRTTFTGDGTNNIVEFKNSGGVTRAWVSANGSDLYVGGNTTESGSVQIGHGATGNQYAYIDMIGDTTYTDYGLRLIRTNGGANTDSGLEHRGTGALNIQAAEGVIRAWTAGTKRLDIDNAGRITAPSQPFFYIRGAGVNWTSTNQGDAPFNNVIYNRGSHFNTTNYRFTAPVAGVYAINFCFFSNGGSAGRLSIKLNGAGYFDSQNQYNPSGFTTWSGNVYLNANDYLTVGDWQNFSGCVVYMGHAHFSGYLLG